MAAINWHIYVLTGSPLALGLLGVCRAAHHSVLLMAGRG
jgi:hypothetical protein